MDVDIDFREEVPDMIKDFGFPMLIQRSSNIFPCSCSYGKQEQMFGNSKQDCRLCNNTGKVIKLEKQKGIKCEHMPEIFDFTKIGIDNSQINDFYFEHYVQLQEHDIIYEVGWQDISKRRGETELIPVSLHSIYRVKDSQPTRGSDGRLEYVLTLCQKENQNILLTQQKFIRNFTYYNRNFFVKGMLL